MGVQWYISCAGLHDAVDGDSGFHASRHIDSDAIAALDACINQAIGQLIGPRNQLFVRDRILIASERNAASCFLSSTVNHPGQN